MIDIVIPLGTGSPYNNDELRYCLRSIQKHCKGYLNIYIIGELPKFVTNVFHVPVKDSHYKETNIFVKLLSACNIDQISNEFLYVNDDHFFIQDCDIREFPNYYDRKLIDHVNSAGQMYRQSLTNTNNALTAKGKDTLNFDIHVPILINKEKFKALNSKYDFYQRFGLVIKSVYGNEYSLQAVELHDMKLKDKRSMIQMQFISPNRPVFSISDEAFDKTTLEALYPNESKYEKKINTAKIGIGFTTHNRHDLIKKAVSMAKKYTPDAKIVVVDDASTKPVENASYRFAKNVGIAKAKNKCLELLDDCDYIFLFDDDTYPAKEKWYEPYIKSGENHLMMTWHLYNNGRPNGHNLIKVENGLAQYTSPCGCMLYVTKKVLETVGGMDEGFVKWGDEHVEWSNRIYNAGLTTYRYADVAGSQSLIYAGDFYKEVDSTVSKSERLKVWKGNNERLNHLIKSKEFKPYKENKNAVFASFFNHGKDVQRGTTWQADISKVMALIESVKKCNERIFIFHNCFTNEQTKFLQDQSVKFIQCEPPADVLPNMARWIVYDEYLQRFQNDFESLFFVDSTDVEMLRSPFNEMQLDRIYVGDEYNQVVGCEWMRKFEASNFKHPEYDSVIDKNKDKRLLNCGLVGGYRSVIKHFIHHLANLHRKYSRNTEYLNDMAAFNYLAHAKYYSIIEHGEKVNTRFKKNEYNNTSWFKHK